MNSLAARLSRATDAIRAAIVTVSNYEPQQILADDDLIDDLALDELELEGLGLIIEEVFAISVPDALWESPLFRTPESLAQWCIRHSDEAAWTEARRCA